MSIKLVTIIGARPQFIKAATVSREMAKNKKLNEIIIHTGQHYDENMSDIFFKEMGIPAPDYHLEINSLSHGAMTGRMLEKIEEVLLVEKPDMILVYGDTNSTLAGALAARKLNLKLAHVEAGLRSFNMKMPEEINRILTDRISNLLFCPTENAVLNLYKEGFQNFDSQIFLTGDVMYDSAIYYSNISEKKSTVIDSLELKNKSYILCSVHRQENTDNLDKLKLIVSVLNEINKKIPVVLPLHPRTGKILKENNIKLSFDTCNPLGYFDIIELLKNSSLVITDSGGMQKEAYFFKKYCLTLRNETEWTELVSNGFNLLVGCDPDLIIEGVKKYSGLSIDNSSSLYGNGNASQKIVELISNL